MTKRFTEREKFRDKWYRNLTPVQKCIWEYFVSECNHAGILELDLKMMSLQIGAEITLEQLQFFASCGKIKFITDELIFIPNFILFQQKLERLDQLNPQNRCHKSILNILEKYKISPLISPLDGASKPQARTYGIGKGKGNNNNITNNTNNDKYYNPSYEICFKLYAEHCSNLVPIRFERRSRAILELLHDFLEEIDYDFEYFKEVCTKANVLGTIMDTKIDFKMLINNHAGITSGKYKKANKTAGDYKY